MSFRLLSALVVSFAVSASAFAATQNTNTVRRSAKKQSANQMKFRAPQVLEVGDNTIGLRASQGGVFEGASVIGGAFEHMIKPNIGIGADGRFASYTHSFGVGDFHGEYEYSVTTIMGFAAFHADLFQVKNLDTYASLGFGRTMVSSKLTTNMPELPAPSADGSVNFFFATINARYFMNAQWGMVASLGTGLGNLGLGLDYLF